MSYKKFVVFTLFSFLSVYTIHAQTTQHSITYGVYGGLNLNFHSPNFTDPNRLIANNLYRVDSVSFSTNSTSVGFALGGIINYPLNDRFQISGRLGYHGIGTTLAASSRRFTASDTVPINSEINASIGMIELSPLLRVKNLFAPAPLSLLAGFEVSLPLFSSYTHIDKTVSGSPSPLLNNQSVQDRISNPIASLDAAMRATFVIGADYEIPLNKTTSLVPEISFRMPFTGISSNAAFDSWSVPQLRIGMSVTFGHSNTMKDDNTPSNLDAQMDNIGYYTNDGLYTPVNFLKVEDIAYSELYPLVPYIFFEANSDKPFATEYPSDNTTARAGAFTLNSLQQDAVSINRSILDIIGYRMNSNKQAQLTITGTTDGKTEIKNPTIAKARAEFVKNYLMNSFGIEESRLQIVARGLPAKPSANTVPQAEAENRRVEFSSSSPDIVAPIILKSDNQRIAYPELIEFRPRAISNKGVSDWSLQISQAGKSLRNFSGNGSLTPQRWQIRPNELSNSQINVEYTLMVQDSSGAKKEVYGTIPVEYLSSTKKRSEQLTDKSISKFSLVLFDFDKAELTEDNARIVEENVIPAIQYNSTVTIIGYSDDLGDANYNQKLSQKRADVIKKVLESKIRDAKYTAKGVGENVPIFDNTSIIGRHLSRTVQIIVETPKK